MTKAHSGYVLFDALFGSFILAIAIAVAGYNVQQGQKAADYAWYGQLALVIAEDVANRIRINTNTQTNFGMAYTRNTVWQTSSEVCSDCSAQQRVRQDGYEVGQMIMLALPDAGVQVNQCGLQLCIVVWWQGQQPAGTLCRDSCMQLNIRV